MIKKLFPHAIEHPLERRSSDEDEVVDLAAGDCAQCEEKESMMDNLSKQIALHAKACGQLADSMDDLDQVLLADEDESFYAVHVSDVKSLKKFAMTFRRKTLKSELDVLRQEVLSCLIAKEAVHLTLYNPESEETKALDEIDRQTIELTSKLVRPLKCMKHRLPIASGLAVATKENTPNLSRFVCPVKGSSYREYMTNLCALVRLLVLSKEGVPFVIAGEEGKNTLKEVSEFCSKHGMFQWHPGLIEGPQPGSTVIIETDMQGCQFAWASKVCCDEDCLSQLEVLYPSLPVRNGIMTELATNGDKSIGTGTDPIVIDGLDEEASEGAFSLLVVDAKETASDEDIMRSLCECNSVPSTLDSEAGLRRSSRRRKTRMPVGVLTSEVTLQADVTLNCAALRLRLLECCNDYHLNHRLLLVVSKVETKADADPRDNQPSKTVILDFSMNQKTLVEIWEDALQCDLSSFVPKESLVLVRQAVVEESAMELSKESIMDELISLSNMSNGKDKKDNKRKKGRTVERGFTGTLLSSSAPAVKKPRNSGESENAEAMNVDKPKESTCTAIVSVDSNPKSPLSLTKGVLRETSGSNTVPMECDSPEGNIEQKNETSPKQVVNKSCAQAVDGPPPLGKDGADGFDDDVDVDGGHNDDDDDNATSTLAWGIADLLKGNSSVHPVNARLAWEASIWTAENNPGEKFPANLVDTAFAKYLELTMD